MQSESELDWMLEEAKKHPHVVHCDFDTRNRVWVNEIIPGRLNEIVQGGGDIKYIVRMIDLTLADATRLIARIHKERPETRTTSIVGSVCATALEAISMYTDEVKL